MKSKIAFSFLEMLFAMTIFATVIAMAMQFLLAMRSYTNLAESRNFLQFEARQVMKSILEDLNSSAWYIPIEESEKVNLTDVSKDRDLRYYPYIQTQEIGGTGSAFGAHVRSDDYLVDNSDFDHPTVAYPAEHMLTSQEIIFVKIQREQPVNFNDTPILMEEYFSSVSEGNTTQSLEYEQDGLDIDAELKFERNSNNGYLREFGYAVIPQATGSSDRKLVRYYFERDENSSDGEVDGTPIINGVSDYVDRVVFDTYRTATGLSVDQIRVTVYLSLVDTTGLLRTHKATLTTAMRSTVDPEYSSHIDEWLGEAGGSSF